MNFKDLDTQHLQLIEAFVNKYLLCRQTMALQDTQEHKSRTYERVIVVEYNWMSTRPGGVQNHILGQLGLFDVKEELEKFIERWKYEVLPAVI